MMALSHAHDGGTGRHPTYIDRQIKSYATGRRAWLFAYDAAGAQASANLYSLVRRGSRSAYAAAMQIADMNVYGRVGRNGCRCGR